ncbi:S-adenosyl-L-methionine-dependent methyltransferase [Xylariaceae sp. FL0804]|nr:S-adenosyl-L-methionine-dependent methyltransferase [Xylariaceae sp. FL0804]
MPPKQQSAKKSQPPRGSKIAETKEDFEEELKALSAQAQDETWGRWVKEQAAIYGQVFVLVSLMAIYANLSNLNLSPVYGQIPATRLHQRVVWTSLFVGWAGNLTLRRTLPIRPFRLLPLIALYIPMAQYMLFGLSGTFGAGLGPAVTESLTVAPLLAVSAACVADALEGAEFGRLPKSVANALPGFISYSIYSFVEKLSLAQLVEHMGKSFVQTRVALELALGATYAAMDRSKLLLYAVPALLHAAFFNTHLMTPMATSSLNSTLNGNGWSVIDRWESVTGYISVVDSHRDGFRVMRCDHSVLGGEWTVFKTKTVAEPIYAIFTQLEAVRLVNVPEKVPDNEAKALNIGLGVGTSPSAMIAHGIDTTIVEIDPVVHAFAMKYFGLPSNHTAVIEDVVSWSQTNAASLHEYYDYIIHDVFTGGAEPIDLFTYEFLEGLKSMLRPNGVIAINYAGDFTLPPLSIVLNTVRAVFPTCRPFRESAPPAQDQIDEDGRDFDNVVIFCTKSEGGTVTFREPRAADFLGSLARREHLLPKHEVPDSMFSGPEAAGGGILRKNDTEKLAKWHHQSAMRHWDIMRVVLPKDIWQMW